jgi:hypothetical protein
MNDKDQESATPRAPLILTIPAYSFAVAPQLDCLADPTGQLFPSKPSRKNLDQ